MLVACWTGSLWAPKKFLQRGKKPKGFLQMDV